MNIVYLNQALLYLLAFIPPALISGPFIPDLLLITSSIIYLCIYFINKIKFSILEKKLFLFFSLSYLYLIISSLNSPDVFHSLSSSLFYFRFFIFIFAVIYCFSNIANSKIVFRNIFLLTMLILLLDCFFQYFFGYNMLGFEYRRPRLSSFFNEELILGGYVSRLYPIFLAFLFIDNNNLKNKYFIIALSYLVFLFVVILSGERSALVFMGIIGLFILTIFPVPIFKKILSLFLIILSILIFFYLNEDAYNRLIHYTLVQIYNDGSIQMSPQHLPIYSSAIEIFKDYPFFGIGPKNFRIFCNLPAYFYENGCQSHPHNYYIQFLAETGFIGFIILFFSFMYILFLLIKVSYWNKEKNYHLIFLILSVFVILWPLVPTGNFFNNWLSVLNFLLISIMFSELNAKKNI